MSEVFKKTITGGQNVQSNKKEMTWTSGEMMRISKDTRKLMTKQQNITKLGHEV